MHNRGPWARKMEERECRASETQHNVGLVARGSQERAVTCFFDSSLPKTTSFWGTGFFFSAANGLGGKPSGLSLEILPLGKRDVGLQRLNFILFLFFPINMLTIFKKNHSS